MMWTRKVKVKQGAALLLMLGSLLSAMPLQAAARNRNTAYWKVFAPQGSGFQVQFPGQPVKKVGASYIQYSYTEPTPNGNVFYGITHENYSVAATEIEDALKKQCQGFAKGFDGQIVNWTSPTKNGYRGMAARVENKTATAMVAAWIINRRLYVIAFAMPKTQAFPAEAGKFMDSLAFVRS